MQLREVKCVCGVVLCSSLCQDLHAKLMSSGSRSATAELNDAHGVPPGSCSYNYYNFSVALWLFRLHMLTCACTAHGFLLLCRLEVIWRAAWRAQTPKPSPKLHLPLYKLILSTVFSYIYMCLHMCVKPKYKKSLFSDEFTSTWHVWQSVSEVKYPFLIAGADSSWGAAFLPWDALAEWSHLCFSFSLPKSVGST